MTTIDRQGNTSGATQLAIKSPCAAATTGAAIVLSGVQTIDGVTVGNNAERVLVKDQGATAATNGIYVASSGPWVLAPDASGNTNWTAGTLVLVIGGSANQGIMFEQTCADNPVVIGTSLIAFTPQAQASGQGATSTSSVAIGTGAKTFATQSGKAFTAGQWLIIQETANNANGMLAQITSYTGTSLVVNVTATGGSGTHADWTIALTNSPAAAGDQPPVGSGNVTGPGSATSGHVATFADTTGKVVQDGGPLGSLAALSSVTAQFLAASAISLGATMLNGTIVASVATGALTLAVKTLAGNDPSATDPVWFVFRSATAAPTSGLYSVVEVTAALSVTVPSGSTMGFTNATPGRLWVTAVNNAGTVSLAVINCLLASGLSTSIFPLGAWPIASITAFGAGANTAQVLYGAASIANLPYSVLGYVTWETGGTLATAGTWNATPTRIDLYRPGVLLPGQSFQPNYVGSNTPSANGGTGVQAFATILGLSANITPTSSANPVEVSGVVEGGVSSSVGTGFVRFARGSTGIAIGQAGGGSQPQASVELTSLGLSNTTVATMTYIDTPNSLTQVTYNWQAATESTIVFAVNRTPTDSNTGGMGRFFSYIQAKELQS